MWTASVLYGGVIITMAVALQPPAIIVAAEEPDWLFASRGESFTDGEYNYFVGWIDIPGPGGSEYRKVVCRLVMPMTGAQEARDQAAREWAKRRH